MRLSKHIFTNMQQFIPIFEFNWFILSTKDMFPGIVLTNGNESLVQSEPVHKIFWCYDPSPPCLKCFNIGTLFKYCSDITTLCMCVSVTSCQSNLVVSSDIWPKIGGATPNFKHLNILLNGIALK